MTTHNDKQSAQNHLPFRLSAKTVHGEQRGRALGYPTINVSLSDVPTTLAHGIYAGWSDVNGVRYRAAVHYGPRPVFGAGVAFEIHLLDTVLDAFPASVSIELIERLRDVENFPDAESLKSAIADDVARTRAILGAA